MRYFTHPFIFAIFSMLTLSSAYALDQRLAGAQFVGVDSKTNQECKVRIVEIEKRFMVDNVKIGIQLGQGKEWYAQLGQYDLTSGAYVADHEQDSVSFKVERDASSASYEFYRFNRDGLVDMPAFSSGRVLTNCRNLHRVDSSAHRDERSNESSGKVVNTGVIAIPITDVSSPASTQGR